MRRFCSLCFALAAVFLLAAQNGSADCTSNSISISGTTGGSLSISVSGKYTVDSAYKLSGIKLFATPSGCGCGQGGEQDVTGLNGSYTALITLPAGKYDVKALLIVTDNCSNSAYYYSTISTNITVSGGGGCN